MKEYFFCIASVLLPVIFLAQDATTINIKKTKWNVSIRPSDSVLWIDKENKLEINVEGGTNYQVELRDGKIRKNKNKYIIEVMAEGAATITVYENLPNKKKKPLYTKLYEVKRIPDPVAYVCGVKGDSVIDKMQLIYDNIITVVHPYYKLQLPVLGFDAIFSFSGQADTLTSLNNHFNLEMKKRIYYLVSGNVLYFDNVYCALPDGKILKLKPFEVFINETNKYKVGYETKGF
jgi:hypothetical protein